jgi:hypothetical protein
VGDGCLMTGVVGDFFIIFGCFVSKCNNFVLCAFGFDFGFDFGF